VAEEPVAETPNALKVIAAIFCLAWAVFWFTVGWFIVPVLNVMLGAAGLGMLALATRFAAPDPVHARPAQSIVVDHVS
jgi:hypothetical protein